VSVDPTAAASTVPPAGLDPDTGHHHADGMLKLAFGAIGIVFGDIGTSPLYAFRETFAGHHKLALDSAHIMGVISLMFWSMMIVPTTRARAAASRCSRSSRARPRRGAGARGSSCSASSRPRSSTATA
jgi:hypothetical protein